jgi:plasmid stabilization system protein ParE
MKRYKISISEAAYDDIQDLFYAIIIEYKSPLTAKSYVAGLYAEIKKLKKTAEMFAIRSERFFLRYGHYVRCVNYKKMAIIYTVHGNLVYVHRVIAANLIT